MQSVRIKQIIPVLVAVFCLHVAAFAFPTWMGVYGTFQRHDGGNPGTFTVLLNEDYAGLQAEIGLRINGGAWVMHSMERSGFIGVNSIWIFTPDEPFPIGSTIDFFFHGLDTDGGHIWDSRDAQNYQLEIPVPPELQWLGAISQWPLDGEVDPRDSFWVNAQTWPRGAATSVSVVYTTNGWMTLEASAMRLAGTSGDNDWWHINLGSYFGGTRIEYAVMARDAFGNVNWAHDQGQNFRTTVNSGQNTIWTGNVQQWPPHGELDSGDDFWINVESWPAGSALFAHAQYSVNGGIWFREPMTLAGMRGNNDWWHLNLLNFPPGSRLFYATEVIDENGAAMFPAVGLSETRVDGVGDDSDGDGLPDDWEIYWWGNLNAKDSDNWDNDGTPDIRLDNRLELALGTEPVHSNDVTSIALLWSPSVPATSDRVTLSYLPSVNNVLTGSQVFASVVEQPTGYQTVAGPMYESPDGRLGAQVLTSHAATNLVVNFRDATNIDDNQGVFWNIALNPDAAHQPDYEYRDSDGDGLHDTEEFAWGSDPLDPASYPSNVAYVTASEHPSANIQQAINSAQHDSWILLRPGLHEIQAPIRTGGKRIIVRGVGDSSAVIIRPANPLRVFELASGESRDTRIENLTITDAATEIPGGAVYIDDSSPTLRRVTFVDCSSAGEGGAAYVSGGAPLFDSCSFSNCVSFAGGGAIATASATGIVIRSSIFSKNRARGVSARGGALKFDLSDFEISTSWLNGNAVDHRGGAVAVRSSRGCIDRCTFTRNVAAYQEGACIGSDGSELAIRDSVLWDNAGEEVSGDAVTVSNSIVQFVNTGPGNRNDNPLFVPGSFRLLADSPCVDAGLVECHDIDGERTAGSPDIGCDEFVDSDTDDMADIWEGRQSFPGSLNPAFDYDGDGLSALEEYEWGSSEGTADSDGDGIPDGWEAAHGLSPVNPRDALTDLDYDRIPAIYQFHHEADLTAAADASMPSIASISEVPDGDMTIQDLINAAPDFGVIELPSGIYSGPGNSDLVLTGKNLLITAAEGANCVIDCKGRGRGIAFGAGVDAGTLFRGITIRNGRTESADGQGGAIACLGASPTIENCVVVSNASEIGGGGIYLEDSATVIRSCELLHNTASYNWGGGLSILGGSPLIQDTTFRGNHAVNTGPDYGGGGLFMAGGALRLENAVIAENRSEWRGGGLFFAYGAKAEVINATIVSNGNSGVYRAAGGVILENSIVWGHTYPVLDSVPYIAPPLLFSIHEGEADPAYGVQDEDPLLDADWMLTSVSPAIDAGSDIGSPDTDIHGEYRWDHPDHPDLVSATDIGADEFVDLDLDDLSNMTEYRIGSNPIATDSDNDGLSDGQEFLSVGTNPVLKDSDSDGFTDGEENRDGMNPLNAEDGLRELEAARRLIAAHWRTLYGGVPAYHYRPGSEEDLAELDGYLRKISGDMVRGVYP